MSLARLLSVTKRLGTEVILENVDFRIERGERIGLIGQNGVGKTTLLRLLTGEYEPDDGVVERMRDLRIGYLPQVPRFESGKTVFQDALSAHRQLLEMEERLHDISERIASGEPNLLEEYDRLHSEFIMKGGFQFRTKTGQILNGLGFQFSEFENPVSVLSGGQRTRLLLAKILLEEADLYLLDEPENHLDLKAREWLESFLYQSSAAFIVVSHDRRMLNHVVTRIVELEERKLTSFSGNFDAFRKHKSTLLEQQTKAYERQVEKLTKTEKWIERFRYKNTKARQVQSRIKQIEKMRHLEPPPSAARELTFRFSHVGYHSSPALRAENLQMSYNGRILYKGLSFELHRQERIGILGPNGCGKTTLLRHLAGKITEPQASPHGLINLGFDIQLGYYDQLQEAFETDRTVLEEISLLRGDLTPHQIRTFLGAFDFTNEDVFKSLSSLSGGERSRISIARLILCDANLLLLDEPTNHLDIQSREMLQKALQTFEGALILVSHDRELLDNVVHRLIIFEPEGNVRLFWGNYSEYCNTHEKQTSRNTVPGSLSNEAEKKKRDQEEKRVRFKTEQAEIRKRQKRLNDVEDEIHDLEQKIREYDSIFANLPQEEFRRAAEMKSEYEILRKRLDCLYEEWQRLVETSP